MKQQNTVLIYIANDIKKHRPGVVLFILQPKLILTIIKIYCSAPTESQLSFTSIYKSGTSKCKFSDLPLLALKFTKFFMSFLEPRVSFSSNFASLFSVMRHNYSALFHLNLYMLWKNAADRRANI